MKRSSCARSRRGAVVGSAAVVFSMVVASPALAATTSQPSQKVAVAQGTNVAALPGAVAFGTTPASTPEDVSFILREHNLYQLKSVVERGGTRDLSVRQFAQRYGQSPWVIFRLERYLQSFGIATDAYADGVDVSATGTAGEFDQALSVQEKQYRVPRQAGRNGAKAIPAQTVHGVATSPKLPSGIARDVLAVLGLTNYAPFTDNLSHINTRTAKAAPRSSNACLALTGLPNACKTVGDFASQYGVDSLYQQGAEGQGQTIGIVTLAALDVGAPEYYWDNVADIPGTNRTVSVDNIDGGPGAPSDAGGSTETDLDVEQSGGLAPGANVVVYQAPNTDPGFADAFFTAASDDVAGSVSASWGESETYVTAAVAGGMETPAYEAAFDEAFLELEAQGQATFVSAGDAGAYDASDDLGSTNLSVDTPGDSPYVTTAGGTTDPWSGTLAGPDGSASVTVAAQRAWGWDYLWKAIASITGEPLLTAAESAIGGGGGGFSVAEPTPSYQQGVSGTHRYHAVEYLIPTDYQTVSGISVPTAWDLNPTPAVTSGWSFGRAEPDLSTNADPYSGYLLYGPAFTQEGQPALEGGWGGTSFVAPELNGSTAVIDSLLGHRVGFWNPTIYSAATSNRSPFTPLDQAGTSNDNLYYTGNPGDVYNPATGLGTPNFGQLASVFARSRRR
jgi:kumamolisin